MTEPIVEQVIRSGGKKTANVRIKLIPVTKIKNFNESSIPYIIVNGKTVSTYFQNNSVYIQKVLAAYTFLKLEKEEYQLLNIIKYGAFIQVTGGGLSSQSQAIRFALSKCFSDIYSNLRNFYKKQGFLTRDARIKERRKYGLKKARKAPQYTKR